MVEGLHPEKRMVNKIPRAKRLHGGDYVAEMVAHPDEGESGWALYLTLGEVRRLYKVREALRGGDLGRAAEEDAVYRPKRVAI